MLLKQFMEDERNRRPFLALALGNDAPVLQRITWSGAVATFIPDMVCKLADYGEIAPGRQALWALLEYVRSQAGVDIQQRIDKLRPLIDWRSPLALGFAQSHSCTLTDTSPSVETSNIDVLVQNVRSLYRDKIQYQCGTMQLLDVSHPVELDSLYVDVNILEDMPSQRWERIADRLKDFDPTADKFDRFYLGKVRQERVPGLEAAANNSKLMVLGKPGSGKTTFLKHLAIECNKGKFQADHVPIFIGLKRFTDNAKNNFLGVTYTSSLQEYISQELQTCDVAAADVESLLKNGRALILLDGLDEVSEQDSEVVRRQIIQLCERYFKNQFAITCRTQAQKYRFENFAYVEVADFNQQQIEDFAKKWFVAVARNSEQKGLARAAEFIGKLKQLENKRVRALTITPILLSLTCLVFNDLKDLPTNRAALYEQGMDILLTRWDEARGIQRDEAYRNLSVPRKIKLLSQVAYITFEQGDYFFEQDKVQQLIANYLCTLPDATTALERLQLDSEAVLKSIEKQHGLLIERSWKIYSFSHLTFQEYLAAREIVDISKNNPKYLESWVSIAITSKRWMYVFVNVIYISNNADELMQTMKQKIDAIVASNEVLQQFLDWLNRKSNSVQSPYKIAAIRAFHLALAIAGDTTSNRSLAFDLGLDRQFDTNSTFDLSLDRYLTRAITYALSIDLDHNFNAVYKLLDSLFNARNRVRAKSLALTIDVKESFQQLKDKVPDTRKDLEKFKLWWQANSKSWIEQLRTWMIEHRNIAHDWQFSEEQKELLKQYYDSNKLLVDCLKSCEVSGEVRQEIEETLLLPIAEIENRRGTGADL